MFVNMNHHRKDLKQIESPTNQKDFHGFFIYHKQKMVALSAVVQQ